MSSLSICQWSLTGPLRALAASEGLWSPPEQSANAALHWAPQRRDRTAEVDDHWPEVCTYHNVERAQVTVCDASAMQVPCLSRNVTTHRGRFLLQTSRPRMATAFLPSCAVAREEPRRGYRFHSNACVISHGTITSLELFTPKY